MADDRTSDEGLAQHAAELAEALLREARAGQTADERAQARKLARMMGDPHGKELTIALADQAFRSRRPERIADQLAYLLERYGVPRYMDWWERVALVLGGAMAHYLPSLISGRQLRDAAASLDVGSAQRGAGSRYILLRKRRKSLFTTAGTPSTAGAPVSIAAFRATTARCCSASWRTAREVRCPRG